MNGFGKDFDYKLAGMRKAQNWTVYPRKEGGLVTVQSDKSIGRFIPETGTGILNTKGCYSPDLLTAKIFKFPEEFIKLCLDNEYKSGQAIGGGVVII